MTTKKFSEAMNYMDDDIISEAINYKHEKKKNIWLKWGTMAACLCLVIAGSTILWRQNIGTPGIGNEGGLGGLGEGTYSVAVYPATENAEDVASADVVSLTESEALSNSLAEYLPKELPDGFHYGRGSIYNTVMKDGTQYNKLRIEYTTDEIPEQQYAEDGAAIAVEPETIGEFFTICVLNYAPKTEKPILSSIEEMTKTLLDENGAVYIRSGDCYIGVFVETTDSTTVLDALRNIE